MYFEVNVALNGIHFFATDPRSIKSKEKLQKIYGIFKEKFPESEGYSVTVTLWEKFGKPVNVNEL